MPPGQRELEQAVEEMSDCGKGDGLLDGEKQGEGWQQQGAQTETGEERQGRSQQCHRADDQITHAAIPMISPCARTPESSRAAMWRRLGRIVRGRPMRDTAHLPRTVPPRP